MPNQSASLLPDLFTFNDGSRVTSPADWPRRRIELLQPLLEVEYGQLPPPPERLTVELLHTFPIECLGEARQSQYRVTLYCPRELAFIVTLLLPHGAGPFPVIINGDACWRYVTDDVRNDVIARGFALAEFNRLEFASDNGSSDRTSGLYRVHPDGSYGALAAWAWGYHRCVDFLSTLVEIDSKKVVVAGHSRGGKTSLLAGATDERIAVVSANNSGCAGAGCFRVQDDQSESLKHAVTHFAYWYARRLADFMGRESELPFDQHFLKAACAPRALLTTEAMADRWANPDGSRASHMAAQQAYHFLGVDENIQIAFREGGHSHTRDDWRTLLDFAARHFGS